MRYREIEFNNYRDKQPSSEGFYLWRANNKATKETLIFVAKFRWRGAGHEDVKSPEFDYWDGYKVHVPECEWAELTCDIKCGEILTEEELEKCPFCKKAPRIGFSSSRICSTPIDHGRFFLKCCRRVKNPSFEKLHDSVSDWNKIIGNIHDNKEVAG